MLIFKSGRRRWPRRLFSEECIAGSQLVGCVEQGRSDDRRNGGCHTQHKEMSGQDSNWYYTFCALCSLFGPLNPTLFLPIRGETRQIPTRTSPAGTRRSLLSPNVVRAIAECFLSINPSTSLGNEVGYCRDKRRAACEVRLMVAGICN